MPAEQFATGWVALPGRHRPLGGGLTLGTDQCLQPTSGSHPDLRAALLVSVEETRHPVTQRAHPLVEATQQIPGADIVMPARQHLVFCRRLGNRRISRRTTTTEVAVTILRR